MIKSAADAASSKGCQTEKPDFDAVIKSAARLLAEPPRICRGASRRRRCLHAEPSSVRSPEAALTADLIAA